MGEILDVDPSRVRPSQGFLKADTLDFIKKNYESGNLDKLPPMPIVRADSHGNLVAIDGHNLLAFFSLKSMKCQVYLAESNTDFLEGSADMVAKRNTDLKEKYQSVLAESARLSSKGITDIATLCSNLGVTI